MLNNLKVNINKTNKISDISDNNNTVNTHKRKKKKKVLSQEPLTLFDLLDISNDDTLIDSNTEFDSNTELNIEIISDNSLVSNDNIIVDTNISANIDRETINIEVDNKTYVGFKFLYTGSSNDTNNDKFISNGNYKYFTEDSIQQLSFRQLCKAAKAIDLKYFRRMRKSDLIKALTDPNERTSISRSAWEEQHGYNRTNV